MMDPIDQHFFDERVLIGKCSDIPTLLDRMADYRDDGRAAIKAGDTKARMRAADLLELAEARVVRLKARALCPRKPRVVGTEMKARREPEAVAEEPFDDPAIDEPVQTAEPEWEDTSWQAEEDEESAFVPRSLLNEDDDRKERMERERTREQERAAMEREQERLRRTRADLEAARAERQRAEKSRQAAERQSAALVRERQQLQKRRAELEEARAARHRAELARVAAETRAAQQRSEKVRIAAEAEAERQRVERERIAAEERALARERAELERLAAEETSARESERAAANASPAAPDTTEETLLDSTAPIRVAPTPSSASSSEQGAESASNKTSFTGSDLMKYRAEQGLTQRAAAERLGVGNGTVAKAETEPTKAVGEALQEAMRRVLQVSTP